MSSINGYDSMSTLLSGLNANNNSNSAMDGLYGINVADYASIRNGSYGKLMKAYYSLDETDNAKADSKNDTDDTDKTLRMIKDSTADLKKSAQELYSSKKLFEKNEAGEYDRKAIYEKVNAFIEDYNATIESVGSAETDRIVKAGASLINATSENADMLEKMGITISGADYKLSIDKEKFMEAKISDIKSMFNGYGSFAYQVEAKASRIYNMVEDKVSSYGGYSSGKTESTSSTSKDTAGTIAKIQENAKTLNATGLDLYRNSNLFKLSYSGQYDTDAIADEIGAFVKDYNNLILSAEKSKSTGINNTITTLKNVVEEYEDKLSKMGITIDKEDDTLVIDKDKLLRADMYDVKKLFNGSGSFAYQVSANAAMVASQAETEAAKANTYTDNATYSNNYNTGTIVDSIT